MTSRDEYIITQTKIVAIVDIFKHIIYENCPKH